MERYKRKPREDKEVLMPVASPESQREKACEAQTTAGAAWPSQGVA